MKRIQIVLATILCIVLSIGVFGAGSASAETNFDFENRTVTLNNGIEMPLVGIGTFTLTDEQASESVYQALIAGYKLIDTANAYNTTTRSALARALSGRMALPTRSISKRISLTSILN